jgi:predicted Na+-dependent transporter
LVSFSIGCLVTLMLSSSIIITQKFKLNRAKKRLIKLESVSKNKASG